MKLLTEKISIQDLREMAGKMFGNLVKAVVDVEKKTIVVDAELHSDEEALLLQNGSRQQDLWGINIYPEIDRTSSDYIEFDSMINLRPSHNNISRGVDSAEIRDQITTIVQTWIV